MRRRLPRAPLGQLHSARSQPPPEGAAAHPLAACGDGRSGEGAVGVRARQGLLQGLFLSAGVPAEQG